MPDNKSKRGARDRSRVAGGEAYEVNYFARKHALSRSDAEKIIKQARGNREKANEIAKKARQEGTAFGACGIGLRRLPGPDPPG